MSNTLKIHIDLNEIRTERTPENSPRPRTQLEKDIEDDEKGFRRSVSKLMDIQASHESEVFCVRYSYENNWLAAGGGDGVIRIYNSGGKLQYTLNSDNTQKLPCTCLRWRPVINSADAAGQGRNRNVLLASNADGTTTHWHVTSQKAISTIEDEDNRIFAMDYNSDGTQFATAGRDFKIRVYEEATKTCITEMGKGISKLSPGHSNRIFATKYNPDDNNVLLSAGWDNTLLIWDIRTGDVVRSIFGPHIAGDAIDISSNTILTASWRPENALQLWDFGTAKLLDDISYPGGPMMYAAQFHPKGDCFAVGGTGSNEGRLIDSKKSDDGFKSFGCLKLAEDKGIYSLAFSPDGTKLALAGATDKLRVFQIK